MSLKPLFGGETKEQHFKTIDDNLAMIAGQLIWHDSHIMPEKIRLLEIALGIKNENDREEFRRLIGTWEYLVKKQAETLHGISVIRKQVEQVSR